MPAEARISTPYCLVNQLKLMKNIHSMQRMVRLRNALLRPHFKTHKSLTIARLQQEAGAAGFTCATINEAQTLAAAGMGDILLAFPLVVDAANANDVRHLHENAQIKFAVESLEAARLLSECLLRSSNKKAQVMIEIDCGCRRSGIDPKAAGEFALELDSMGLDVRGIFTYPGQGYSPNGASKSALDEAEALTVALRRLEVSGFANLIVSGGSTPTMQHFTSDKITEYRPGTYLLGDRQQAALGMARSMLSLQVVTTVVHASPGRIVLDAGAKSIGRDRPPWLDGFAELTVDPSVVVDRIYDHHAVIDSPFDVRVGSRLRIYPNNANTVVNNQAVIWLEMPDGSIRPTPVDARSSQHDPTH